MIRQSILSSLFFVVPALALASGCGGAEEVTVSGEAKSASAQEITLQFFEVAEDGEEASVAPVKTIKLAEPGAFMETIEVESSKIRVVALADTKHGACTEGEEWAEATAGVSDEGTIAPITLELAKQACPAASAAK